MDSLSFALPQQFHLRLKRGVDIGLASTGLLMSTPIVAFIALAIKLFDGGPVFYSQQRVGRYGRPFRIWKFRTMVTDADRRGPQVTSGADRRITPIGRMLRKTKLDELPQLWNVLIGEMTLVGPRPEVQRYVDRYTPEQRAILELTPGITDLATVAFRNEEELLRGAPDVEEFYVRHCLPRKIELNLFHARQASLVRDFWVLAQTLCPYWVGVLALYGLALSTAYALSHLLLTDFEWREGTTRAWAKALPWIIGPQVLALMWQGQARGLLSYFSIPEMRRTLLALLAALPLQAVLARLSLGAEAPGLNLILTHLLVAFFALCGVRMAVRLVRESSTQRRPPRPARATRIAVVGVNPAGTDLALNLQRQTESGRRVVAFFDDNPLTWQQRPHDVPVFGMPECLANPVWHARIDEVMVVLPEEAEERAIQIQKLLLGTPMRIFRLNSWPILAESPRGTSTSPMDAE